MDELDPANYTMKPPRAAPQMVQGEAKAFVEGLSDDELRKLAREQLSKALQYVDAVTQPEMTRKLCAELMDRLDGRPAQYIEQRSLVATLALDERKIEARKEAENLLILLAKSASS